MLSIGTMSATPPPEASAACAEPSTLQADSVNAAACILAENLEKAFVHAEQGSAHAAALRVNVAADRYRAFGPRAAAARMTADLQAVAPHGHLRVALMAQRRRPEGQGIGPPQFLGAIVIGSPACPVRL